MTNRDFSIDLTGLPQELIDQLSKTTTKGRARERILAVLTSKPQTVNEILIAIYRKFKVVDTRQSIYQALRTMAKGGKINYALGVASSKGATS